MEEKHIQERAELLGEAIREVRVAHSVSQDELALAVGTSQSYIARIEMGRINVTAAVLMRIAEALEVEVRDFIDF